ncbi:MAG: helix-turn-helix domain-containing protein [Eubacteriales bacterium]|nr:helix-turn-helix domain-containing protein [Oscillospiraceae bacterium]MDD4493632.1 helix-turn-helix domain-containing protein [Eubacteriales bacterium]
MEKTTRITAEKMTSKYPDVLDVAAATKILNLSKTRVNELIAEGAIPAIFIGRKNFIAKESLIDYLCR